MLKFSFKRLPVDSEGKAYESLEEFQAAEIKKLFIQNVVAQDERVEMNLGYAKAVVENKAAILEILEVTMDARPAARGQKRPRKNKAEAAPATSEPAPAT